LRGSLLAFAAANDLSVSEVNTNWEVCTPSLASRLIGVDVREIRRLVDTEVIQGYWILPDQSRFILHDDLVRFVHDEQVDCELRDATTHPDQFDGRGVA
jgi:hypothetical protein